MYFINNQKRETLMIKTKVLIAAMLAAQLVSSAVCAAETGGVNCFKIVNKYTCKVLNETRQ